MRKLLGLNSNSPTDQLDQQLRSIYDRIKKRDKTLFSEKKGRCGTLPAIKWVIRSRELIIGDYGLKLVKTQNRQLALKTIREQLSAHPELLDLFKLKPNPSPEELVRPLREAHYWAISHLSDSYRKAKPFLQPLPIKEFCGWKLTKDEQKRKRKQLNQLGRKTLRKQLNDHPKLLDLFQIKPNYSPKDLDRPLQAAHYWGTKNLSPSLDKEKLLVESIEGYCNRELHEKNRLEQLERTMLRGTLKDLLNKHPLLKIILGINSNPVTDEWLDQQLTRIDGLGTSTYSDELYYLAGVTVTAEKKQFYNLPPKAWVEKNCEFELSELQPTINQATQVLKNNLNKARQQIPSNDWDTFLDFVHFTVQTEQTAIKLLIEIVQWAKRNHTAMGDKHPILNNVTKFFECAIPEFKIRQTAIKQAVTQAFKQAEKDFKDILQDLIAKEHQVSFLNFAGLGGNKTINQQLVIIANWDKKDNPGASNQRLMSQLGPIPTIGAIRRFFKSKIPANLGVTEPKLELLLPISSLDSDQPSFNRNHGGGPSFIKLPIIPVDEKPRESNYLKLTIEPLSADTIASYSESPKPSHLLQFSIFTTDDDQDVAQFDEDDFTYFSQRFNLESEFGNF